MSDNFLIFIPTDADFEPEPTSRTRAVSYLRDRLPSGEDFSDEVSSAVEFVGCGSNFESVHCPSCGASLDIGWWSERMDVAAKSGFAVRVVEVPCCGRSMDLNQLEYRWPAGFARYSLSVRNPGEGVEKVELRFLEELLNTPLRVIRAHL